MFKKSSARGIALLLMLILAFSMLNGVLSAPLYPNTDFPVVVEVDGSVPKTYIFATHTGSSTAGNWIELSGGTVDITLPYLSIQYNGVEDTTYTKTGDVAIDTDPVFSGDAVVYPFDSHPLYIVGDTVEYKLWGSASLTGDVDFLAIYVDDPIDYENAISDLYNGDNDAFEALLDTGTVVTSTTFDVNGDATGTSPAGTAGDYILLALYETGSTTFLYSATIVEIVDGGLTATVPVDEIDEGDDLDIDLTYGGASTGTMVYGAVMIRESAYQAIAQMTSSGSVASTEVTVNDATVVDGSGGSFSLFAGGFGGFDTDAITDFMSQAFSSSEYAVAFSSSTASTSATVSLTTNGLAEDDYVILCGIWDYSADISTGDRLLGLTQDTVYVDRPVFLPPIGGGGGTTTPTQDEFDDQSTEEKANTITTLTTSEAVDLLEGSSTEDAAQVLEKLDSDKAAELLDAMDETKATELVNTMQTEAAAQMLTKSTPQKATQILTQTTSTKAGQIVEKLSTDTVKNIVEESVTTAKTTQMATVLNSANKETVGDVLLAVQPSTGAKVIREMATQDLTGAAERVEAAVKRQINSLDPGQKQQYRQKLKETMENPDLSVDDLVNLFTSIANLPETPSVVAEIFEIINVNKTVQVVDGMVAKSKETEAALVFSYLSTDKLVEIYEALSSATRTALYPYFDAVTVANLPHLGEFTVTDLTLSDTTVAPGTSVTVTGVLSNIGSDTDSTTVTISVDGTEIDSDIVTLDSGESTTVTWVITKTDEGTYTVDVMGETETFTVEAAVTPAEFELSNLQVSPSMVEPGDDVTVTFTVENTGEESGDYSVPVKVDGATVDTLTGTLAGGDSETLTATVSSVEEGTHTVSVDGLDAEFNVEVPPSKFPWTYVVAAVVIVAAAAYIYMQQQKQ